MKIDDKNKHEAFKRFMVRSGVGFSKKYYARRIPDSVWAYMHQKPYGGIYEQKHTEAGE